MIYLYKLDLKKFKMLLMKPETKNNPVKMNTFRSMSKISFLIEKRERKPKTKKETFKAEFDKNATQSVSPAKNKRILVYLIDIGLVISKI